MQLFKKIVRRLGIMTLTLLICLGGTWAEAAGASAAVYKTAGSSRTNLTSGGTSGGVRAELARKKKKKKKSSNNSNYTNSSNNSGSSKNNSGNSSEGSNSSDKNSNKSNGSSTAAGGTGKAQDEPQTEKIDEDGNYTSKEDVALYIHLYGHLPDNFITKNEAKDLGWVNSEGNLDEVAPGKSIGGDYFGNYEGQLPEKKGRKYYECDIDYTGGYRDSKRIIYSNDGLVYYTEDHYKTFEQLY